MPDPTPGQRPITGGERLHVVRSLYGDVPSFILGIVVAIVGSGLTAYRIGSVEIAAVCGVIALLAIARLISMALFAKAVSKSDDINLDAWERLYIILGALQVASVGCWSTAVFYYGNDALSELMSIACGVGFLIGIQGRNFSSPTIVRLQIVAAAVPVNIAFLLKNDIWYFICGVFFTLFLVSVLRTSARICGTFVEAVRTARVNASLAYRDPLTGLPNRAAMQRLLADAVARDRLPFALHFVDLDRFKRINDTLGHAMGDRLLVQAARRFHGLIGENDMISRYAGDEFVILQRLDGRPGEIAAFTDRLIASAAEPFDLGATKAQIGCSIGTALYPQDALTADLLTQRADTALYHVKNDGRGRSAFYSVEMSEKEQARLSMESDLRTALAADALTLAFQPIVRSGSFDIASCEALVRWQHPVLGNVPPATFLPIAEDAGLMDRVTDTTIRLACRAAAQWPGHVAVAVNISPSQLHRDDLVDVVEDTVRQYGLSPNRFEIEITENLPLEFEDKILARLTELKRFGIRLSLDDFGTGYSNLGYISRLPIDKIKIDKSFLRDIETDPRRMGLLRGVLRFVAQLDLCVLVEGVETPAQLDILAAEPDVDQMQGFIFGYPLSEKHVSELLHTVASRGRLDIPVQRREQAT
ncbi:putative bifunctional diguanylate cyclase/phosphodiesterase [Mangrovicella endophytica]|uniref:putative bifunctional diguanylate cyclase/phosphodiesterase n=1 Tax=Mangrovicella endophytica TaxID=2066697 RepID=UPI0018E4185F|nr:EAL domain-containing protein [Mangrovicella endophytica]